MDRCALFVDASYVLADGAVADHGRQQQSAWDYAALLKHLTDLARDRTALPVLRCYWYESGAPGRGPAEHEALASLPGVKLRLTSAGPGEPGDAGAALRRDLLTLARNRAVSDAVIVSAREELGPVIADAQDHGARVLLMHLSSDLNRTAPRLLRQECDDVVEIPAVSLAPFAHSAAPAAVPGPAASPGRPAGLAAGVMNQPGSPPVAADGSPGPAPAASPVLAPAPAAPAAPAAAAAGGAAGPAPAAGARDPGAARRPGPPGGAPGRGGPVAADPAAVVQPREGSGPGTAPASGQGLTRQDDDTDAMNRQRPYAGSAEPSGLGYGSPGPAGAGPAGRVPRRDAAGGSAQNSGGQSGLPPYGAYANGMTAAGPPPDGPRRSGNDPAGPYQSGSPAAPYQHSGSPGGSSPGGSYPDSSYPGGSYPGNGSPGGPYHSAGAPAGPYQNGLGQPAPGPNGGGRDDGGRDDLGRNDAARNAGGQPGYGPGPNGLPSGGPPAQGAPADGLPPADAARNGRPALRPVRPEDDLSSGARRPATGPLYPRGQSGGYGETRQPPHDRIDPLTAPRAPQHEAPYPARDLQPPAPGDYRSQPPAAPATGPRLVPEPAPPAAFSLDDAVQAARAEGAGFGESVVRDAPALWLEAVLARKPRMPSDLEARLLQGSALPIDSLLHDDVRQALRQGFWDALQRSRR